MTAISRGDIVLVLFPNSDLQTLKRRPGLVVQRDQLDSGLAQVVVAMISGNLARQGHPSRVTLRLDDQRNSRTGLAMDSVVITDNLATILLDEIDRTIGRLASIESVDAALQHTLSLQ